MRTRLALVIAALVTLGTHIAYADPPDNEEIEELTEQIEAAPNDVNLLLERAEVYRRERMFQEALADLRVAIALQPSDARTPVLRARVLHDSHRHSAALAEIDALLQRESETGNAEAHALRAHILEALDRLPEALVALERTISLRSDVNDHIERGQWLTRLGRRDEALVHYGEALVALGGPAALRHDAVTLALRQRRSDLAITWTTEVIENTTGPARWLLLRARAHELQRHAAAARADRTRALADVTARAARRPSVALLVERGEALLALGRVGEARRAVDAAIARDPRYRPARALRVAIERRTQTNAGGAR